MGNTRIITIRAFRTNNFTAKLIHIGDWLDEKVNNRKHVKCFNHWEVGFEKNGVMLTSGSVKKGTITRPLITWLASFHKSEMIEWDIELNKQIYDNVISYISNVENTPYEKSIFWKYPFKTFFKKWYGKNDMSKMSCVENAARAINESGKFEKICLDLYPSELQTFLNNKSMEKGKLVLRKGNEQITSEPEVKPPSK